LKKRITIPKGFADCDGGKCEKTQTFEIDFPETKPIIETVPQIEIQGINQTVAPPIQAAQTTIPQTIIPPTPKTYSNEELTNLMPPGQNFAMCKGDNCSDSKLKNKTQITKFKECPKCGCNNVPKNSSMCPCCGVDEPQDDDDKENYWDESSIEIEKDDEE